VKTMMRVPQTQAKVFLASFLWRLVNGSVEKEVVVIADHTFTAHHAVIVVRRMAERSPFQFQVSMFTG